MALKNRSIAVVNRLLTILSNRVIIRVERGFAQDPPDSLRVPSVTEHRQRKARVLSDEQRQERFSTDGWGFPDSLRLVLRGGRDDEPHADSDEGERER